MQELWRIALQQLLDARPKFRSKGVFAGLTLEGAVIEQDSDSTKAVYGRDVSFASVLRGKVETPDITRAFMKAVAEAAHKAKSQEAREGGQ